MQTQTQIKIVSLDTSRTKPSSAGGNTMRNLYLELSEVPPSGWSNFFDQERNFSGHTIHTMKRKAWIEGKYIVIDCVPKELEHYYLGDLKADVYNANQKYNQAIESEIQRRKIEEKEMKRQEGEENECLEHLKGCLDFG